jgi:TonB family protein
MKNLLLSFLFVVSFCVFSFAQNSEASGGGNGQGKGVPTLAPCKPTESVRIISKPSASYTDAARKNGIEGTVVLKVNFAASGQIATIFPVSSLPYGLTEQAIAAARKIRFESAKKDGVPCSVIKGVEYKFSIYYKEDDEDLEKIAEITEIPKVDFPTQDIFDKGGGKISIEVILKSTGEVEILNIDSDLPKDYVEKVKDAVSKIKFTPAIYKNGKQVSQIKVFEYEFKPNK